MNYIATTTKKFFRVRDLDNKLSVFIFSGGYGEIVRQGYVYPLYCDLSMDKSTLYSDRLLLNIAKLLLNN